MAYAIKPIRTYKKHWRTSLFCGVSFCCQIFLLAGCGRGGPLPNAPAAPPPSSDFQTYFAPFIAGQSLPQNITSASIYQFDDNAQTFAQSIYRLNGTQTGASVIVSGTTAPLARGLLNLAETYTYTYASSPVINRYNPPQFGNWALELSGQAGGLVSLLGQPPSPIVPAQTCPHMTKAQSFLFVTLPGPPAATAASKTWDPATDTAYGSVDISASGDNVTFGNIQQFTLAIPPASPKPPLNPSPATVSGACSPTFYGNTISVPGQITITNPGSGETVTPAAIVGIGPTGFLAEGNGNPPAPAVAPFYQNVLGAGTGAIGLPKPSAAVDTTALVSAEYMGFFYGTGDRTGSNSPDLTSLVASFGFPALPATCKSVATQTSTMLYGGDFSNNDPSQKATQTAGGYSRCNVAVDLGTQDPSSNGVYPAAKVTLGTAFTANLLGSKYTFPAVAIAGQLNGKYAIFLLGLDTTGTPNQAWGIYLLQSN